MRGQRVHDAVPKNFGRNVSILGSLSWYGMEAVMTVEGAVDAAVFRAPMSVRSWCRHYEQATWW
jgi:hypothetical protein